MIRTFQIRSYADARAWLTETQFDVWRGSTQPTGGLLFRGKRWSEIDADLKHKRGNFAVEAVHSYLNELADMKAEDENFGGGSIGAGDVMLFGRKLRRDYLADRFRRGRTLEQANLEFAAALYAKAPIEFVNETAPALGVKADAGGDNTRAACALQTALNASALGKTLAEIEREYNAHGNVIPWGEKRASGSEAASSLLVVQREAYSAPTPPPRASTVFGAGSLLSEFFEDVGDWFGDAVIKNLGRVLVTIGGSILDARENVPFLGQFFLDPLGFTAQATFLEELGKAAISGSINTFNEARVGFAVGQSWSAMGQALLIAAPFLAAVPPPGVWMLAAAAIGAGMMALGNTVQGAIANQAAATQNEKIVKAAQDQAKAAQTAAHKAEQQAREAMEAAENELAEAQAAASETPTGATPRLLPWLAGAGTAAAAVVALAIGLVYWK